MTGCGSGSQCSRCSARGLSVDALTSVGLSTEATAQLQGALVQVLRDVQPVRIDERSMGEAIRSRRLPWSMTVGRRTPLDRNQDVAAALGAISRVDVANVVATAAIDSVIVGAVIRTERVRTSAPDQGVTPAPAPD
jgi:hypothetical protein